MYIWKTVLFHNGAPYENYFHSTRRRQGEIKVIQVLHTTRYNSFNMLTRAKLPVRTAKNGAIIVT